MLAEQQSSADQHGRPVREVSWTSSGSFPELLAELGCSLLVSTYQAGQLAAIGTHEGRLQLNFRRYDQAMGVGVGGPSIAVGSRDQVWFLREQQGLASRLEPAGRYDRCFLPRHSAFTGAMQGHEIAWGRTIAGDPDLWIVNTSFSCLVGLDEEHNFVPRWRPPFISGLAPEDRCHLNGLAMRDGLPAYVTAMAWTDQAKGWRQLPKSSGLVMDVGSGSVVTQGLVMPHSPRWYRDQLLVLNSGMGCLEVVDRDTGGRETIAPMPGFTRGLGLHDGYAFVGLSRIRETVVFGEVPLAEYHDQLKCGVGVIEIATGRTVATFEFLSGVEEIFDVQVVPDARCVAIASAEGDDIWVLPSP